MVFVTAKSWKQYKDPAIGEQLNEYVAIQLVLHKLLKCLWRILIMRSYAYNVKWKWAKFMTS